MKKSIFIDGIIHIGERDTKLVEDFLQRHTAAGLAADALEESKAELTALVRKLNISKEKCVIAIDNKIRISWNTRAQSSLDKAGLLLKYKKAAKWFEEFTKKYVVNFFTVPQKLKSVEVDKQI